MRAKLPGLELALGQGTVESGKPLCWDVWTPPLASGIALGFVGLAVDPPRNARWVGGNGFDDGMRDALRAGSASGRNSASTARDALFAALGGTLVVDRALGREIHLFIKSLGSDATWFFSNRILTQVVKVSAGRQRPFVTPSASDPDYSSACDSGRDRNASFFSGHASSSATLAGLLGSRQRIGGPSWRSDITTLYRTGQCPAPRDRGSSYRRALSARQGGRR